MTLSNVPWDSNTSTDVSISSGTITGTGGASWTGNVKSDITITSGDKIKITNPSSSSLNQFAAGLGANPYDQETNSYVDVEYAWIIKQNDTWSIFESGTLKHNTNAIYSSTDHAEIIRSGTDIKYYLNGVLIYTSSNTTSAGLYPQVATVGSGQITMQYGSTAGTGGSSSIADTEGSPLLEHILYLNTRVPT